jgi:WD40 repeat protein
MRVVLLTFFLATSSFAAEEARHTGPVTGIAVTKNTVYSCSQAGILSRDKQTSTFAKVMTPEFRVIDITAIGDGQLAVCGGLPGASGIIGILDIASGELNTQTVSKDLIYAQAFSRSSETLAVACADGNVMLLNLPLDSSEKPVVIHKHTAAARAVAFSPDGTLLVSGGLDGVLLSTRLDEDESPRVLQEHTAGIESLSFSSDGKHFASGARDSKVRLHSTDGRLIRTYAGIGMENELAAERLPTRVWALAWDDTRLVAGTSKGQLYHLSNSDDQWTLLENIRESIYVLGFDSSGLLWAGSNASLVRK